MARKRPCCVPDCEDKTLRRFSIPRDHIVRDIWIERIGNAKLQTIKIENSDVLTSYVVCERHFDMNMCKNANGKLLKYSLPTLNLPEFNLPSTKENCFYHSEAHYKFVTLEKVQGILKGAMVAETTTSQLETAADDIEFQAMTNKPRSYERKSLQFKTDSIESAPKIMGKCLVVFCKNRDDSTKPKGISFHRVTRERYSPWMEAIGRNPDKNQFAIYTSRICSEHFTPDSFSYIGKDRVLKKDAIPTLKLKNTPKTTNISRVVLDEVQTEPSKQDSSESKSHSGSVEEEKTDVNSTVDLPEEPERSSLHRTDVKRKNQKHNVYIRDCNMEQLTCRTCLNITDKKKCTEISQICCLDKTIKDVIVLLVPQMASTLFDNECVCKNCLKTLRFCMSFIKRCLEIELINIENQLTTPSKIIAVCSQNEENLIEINENILLMNEFPEINSDHNYYIKFEPEDCVDTNNEKTVEDDSNSENCDTQLLFTSSVPDNVEVSILNNHCTSPEYIIDESLSADKNGKSTTHSEHLDLETSQLNSAKKKKFSCRTCSEKFSCRSDYKLHQQIHPAFICHLCGKCIKSEFSYKFHMMTHTRDRLKLCHFCGKRFANMGNLRLHVAVVHKHESPFMCDKCPKRFKNKIKLSLHIRMVHDKVRQQKCQECGKLFFNRNMCQRHYRLVHLKLKPFVCNVCGKEFGRKDYLLSHMYVHTGEPRPKQQNISKKRGIRLKDPVEKSISSVHSLKTHRHIKMKRHRCKYCKLTFTLSKNRDRHQQHHELDPENAFRCDICWKRMNTEQERDMHVQDHYIDRLPHHSCNICGEKFHRKYLMHCHQLEVHTGLEDIEVEQETVVNNLLEYAHPSFCND